jgi:RNA polymerase sigma factor (sigma-70 family)
MTDHELLDSFTSRKDQAAFAELVRRYIDLVYNACLRQTRGSPDLADDATQAVFFLLARRGGRISKRVVIAGWLYTTARHAASNALRAERRRRHHERRAGLNMPMTSSPPGDASRESSLWQQAAPILDDALNALAARDRDALLLRYFQNKSTRDVSIELAVSEEAARQRVSRAVDKLRRAFARRGMAVTTIGVAGVFATMSAAPAPAAVATASIATAGAGAGAGGVLPWIANLAKDTLFTIRIKPLLKTFAAGGVAVAIGIAATVLVAGQPTTPPARAGAVTRPAATTTAATKPTATSQPDGDAASLVREVRAAEQWIDTVKSLRLKVALAWSLPRADGVAHAAPPVPQGPETIVLTFDDHRLYYRADAKEYRLINHRTWDGTTAVIHEKYSPKERNQEHYSLDKEPWTVGSFFMSDLSWPRAGLHAYWWVQGRRLNDDVFGGTPEDFYIAGRETFRGVECYVVQSDLYYRTLHVGIADHRLYGLANRVLPRTADNSRGPIAREVASEMGANDRDVNAWLATLTDKEKKQYQIRLAQRMRPFSRPQATHWYGDYKEVATGCWMPMHQGYDLWNTDGDPMTDAVVTKTHDMRVVEVAVNEPLSADLFKWDFSENVDVVDRRPEAALFYKFKKHFEPAEWQAILDEAAQRKARMRPGADNMSFQMHRTDALGKPAPPFPGGATWINSPPLTMVDLKGKVVIVECFASWSKFSLDELSKVIDLHEHGKDGVMVIGVHAPGTPADDVRKWVKEHGVTFPVCIDTPVGNGPWEGTLFNAYHVMDVPNAYVIDRAGRVTLEGTPGGAVTYAPRVTTRPTKRP